METSCVAIVEDDESLRNAIRNLLAAAGYSSATFEDAESFLRSDSRAHVACLVADMRMPGMSGLDLHKVLVASGAGIPTVIITAHPEEMTRSRARKAGICCYLIKPFDPEDLLECVRAALAKRRDPVPKS
jgi:FixJ family two-component response regulator